MDCDGVVASAAEGPIMHSEHSWALVLAAGEGRRLRELTTTASGSVVPKQYCSLFDGPSLLQDALRRAEATAPAEHICTVVAANHRRWWLGDLQGVPAANVIVQPQNRGTGNGILLSLLNIVERDPDARVVLLPSDHYVEDEHELARWLKAAATRSSQESADVVLLGFEPRSADPELGYVVPRRVIGSRHSGVGAFVEKPPIGRARELVRQGALWNAFIIAGDARALLALYEPRWSDLVVQMRAAVRAQLEGDPRILQTLYDELPDVDFSRHVLEATTRPLRVVAVPQCGWSDLGTPERVGEAVLAGAPPPHHALGRYSPLSLAVQHARARALPGRRVAEHVEFAQADCGRATMAEMI
jgi:mannose-1-phosphate guanylyltransferase